MTMIAIETIIEWGWCVAQRCRQINKIPGLTRNASSCADACRHDGRCRAFSYQAGPKHRFGNMVTLAIINERESN